MASPVINAAPACAAPQAAAAPLTQCGSPPGGGASSGPSFKDLLNGQASSAPPETADPLAEETASVDEDSGEELPAGGNPLPLLAILLPPPAEQTDETALSEDEGAPPAPLAAASEAPAAEVPTLPVSTAPVQNSADTDATPVVDQPVDQPAVPAATAPTADAGKQSAVITESTPSPAASPTAALPPAAQKPEQPLRAHEHTNAASMLAHARQPSTDTPTSDNGPGEHSAAATAIAARLARNDDGTDGAVLRRLLASLTGAQQKTTGDPKADSASSAAGPAAATDTEPTFLSQLQASLTTALPAKDGAPVEAQQVLRELKFDRVPDVAAPAAPAATHAPAAQQPATPATATNDPAVLQLQTPLQNRAEWANGLGERIVWMTNHNQQNAQIRLNPPHLGPIEVQVSVVDDKTSVLFTAHHAATREALEAAAPRLRDMLGSQGLGSVNVNINHHSSSERSAQNPGRELWGRQNGPAELEPTGAVSLPVAPTSHRTLFDAYA